MQEGGVDAWLEAWPRTQGMGGEIIVVQVPFVTSQMASPRLLSKVQEVSRKLATFTTFPAIVCSFCLTHSVSFSLLQNAAPVKGERAEAERPQPRLRPLCRRCTLGQGAGVFYIRE